MRVSAGKARGGAVITSSGSGGSSGGDGTGLLSGMTAGLPPWASALLTTVLVLIVAAIVGILLGKLYASVKYPDPEKHTVLPPLMKVGFICLIVACSVWLFGTLMKQPGDDLMVGGDPNIPSFEEPSFDDSEDLENSDELLPDELEELPEDDANSDAGSEEATKPAPKIDINPAT